MLQCIREVMVLQTFYVDVYFLINFTVDILALYVAVRVAHIRVGILRLSVSAAIGAAMAVADVFLLRLPAVRIPLLILGMLATVLTVSPKTSVRRRGKLLLLFLTVQLLLGGGVSFGYSILDRILENSDIGEVGTENRGALVLSVLVLFSIGVIRLIIMIFTDMMNEKAVRLEITVADTTVEADALLDSGNLVKDPMNMHPVLFIKPSLASRLVPRCVAELNDLDRLDEDYRKRIRLIPVSRVGGTHVMTGVRPDRVVVSCRGKSEAVEFTIAIDKEGGSYGGYEALAPLAAINDAF